ncbi:hypothetical protein M0R79_07695 [Ignavigranum ruoffiae]|uniref:hypothetical protein n=1 Tax=Ignavigranum ruoffiae TaxID=89093 RepID=UPI00205AB73F|nr:hypothetical protein [Ignavigranum ruoffiae]UPQ85526.1 hypothetical protein M0R79_07695 [Ignavigranum ruoffiae]
MTQEELIDQLNDDHQDRRLPEDADKLLTETMNQINGFLKDFTNQLAQSDLDPDEYFLGSDGIMSVLTLSLQKNKLNFSRYQDGILVEFYNQATDEVSKLDQLYFDEGKLQSRYYQEDISSELVDHYLESFRQAKK